MRSVLLFLFVSFSLVFGNKDPLSNILDENKNFDAVKAKAFVRETLNKFNLKVANTVQTKEGIEMYLILRNVIDEASKSEENHKFSKEVLSTRNNLIIECQKTYSKSLCKTIVDVSFVSSIAADILNIDFNQPVSSYNFETLVSYTAITDFWFYDVFQKYDSKNK